MRAFSVVILSLITTILLGAALLLGMPVDFAELAIWMTFFISIIWVFIMLYCCWDPKKWRVVGVLVATSCVSVLVIIMNPPAL